MPADFVQIFLAEKCLIISEGMEWQAGGGRVIHLCWYYWWFYNSAIFTTKITTKWSV